MLEVDARGDLEAEAEGGVAGTAGRFAGMT